MDRGEGERERVWNREWDWERERDGLRRWIGRWIQRGGEGEWIPRFLCLEISVLKVHVVKLLWVT